MAYIEKVTADLWSFFTMAAAIVQLFFCSFRVVARQINLLHSAFLCDKMEIVQSTELANNRSSGVIATAKK